MRVLVTGHLGYVGRHLVPLLEAAGHEVTGWDERGGDYLEHIDDDEIGLRVTPDAVIHLAAQCRVGESVQRPAHYWHDNAGGTADLLWCLASRGFRGPFVLASTLLARHPESSPYAASKWACERMLADAARAHGFPAVALRLGNVAGNADPTPGRLVPAACLAARDGGTVTLRGNCVRDYAHVAEVARAFLLAMSAPVGRRECLTLDIGTGQGTASSGVCCFVEAVSDREVRVAHAAALPHDPPACVADPRAALAALGWRASPTLAAVRSAWEACRGGGA